MFFPFPFLNHSKKRRILQTLTTSLAIIRVTTEQGYHRDETISLSSRRQKAEFFSFMSASSIGRQKLTVNAHQNRGLGEVVWLGYCFYRNEEGQIWKGVKKTKKTKPFVTCTGISNLLHCHTPGEFWYVLERASVFRKNNVWLTKDRRNLHASVLSDLLSAVASSDSLLLLIQSGKTVSL